ncbi:hypothetical protein FH609_005290 [Streptomyces sp. 3MP-14]|uniref:Uncharacterized protein n=1 Tax=Streptomyces mimosae TaxID=2586635 RepID=A0A5N6AM17_9ACTN|nr:MULTISPECIES: hypothetical protein [Streptomyces]KAB8169711.1 hypothetical protein FH607_002970 [Streptomyces mimosae]KAB8178459.1 hypothetical protein FH609_005290 [Streptomyces sp. 3MP-14]
MRAHALEPELLLTALKAGHFNSSTGPQLFDVHLTEETVEVRCSPAREVFLSGGAPGARVVAGTAVTECSCPELSHSGAPRRLSGETNTASTERKARWVFLWFLGRSAMTRTKKFIAALCLALGLVGAVATPSLADKQKPVSGADVATFGNSRP